MNNNKVYDLAYGAVHTLYERYLPDVEKSISTFELTGKVSQPVQMSKEESSNTPAPMEGFLAYENPAIGIRLQYPEGWDKIEDVGFDSGATGVVFSPSSTSNIKDIRSLGINYQLLPSPATTLSQFADKEFNHTKAENFKGILESNETTVAGLPAHKVVSTQQDSSGKDLISMKIFTIKDGIGYTVFYTGLEGAYSNFMPITQKVINSLEITK